MKRTHLLIVAIFGILSCTRIQAMDRFNFFQAGRPERVSSDWHNRPNPAPQQAQTDQAAELAYKKQTDSEYFDDFPTQVSALTTEDRKAVDEFILKLGRDCRSPIDRWNMLYSNYRQYRNTMAKAVMLRNKCSEFLGVAVRLNDHKLVEHLLIYGANAQDLDLVTDRPIIHHAQSVPVAQSLLQHGAPITAVDKYAQHTLLHHACYCSSSFELLVFYVNEFKKRNLLEKYINDQESAGRVTPMHYLISSAVNHRSGFKECFPEVQKKLALLLENGADCQLKTWLGKTPQDEINSIIANPDIHREEGTHPYWAQITAQLAAATEKQLQMKAAKQAVIREGQRSCAICLSELEQSEDCMALPCAHVFHTACVQPWINAHHNCPTCRTNVPGQNNNNNNNNGLIGNRVFNEHERYSGWYL